MSRSVKFSKTPKMNFFVKFRGEQGGLENNGHIKSVIKDVNNGKRIALPCVEDGDVNVTASYDRRGTMIYCGNSKGKIFVINSKLNKLIKSFKVGTSNNAIKQIKFARKGEYFLTNSIDR